MSLIALRIDHAGESRMVTKHASRVRFRTSSSGGYIGLTARITLPLSTFPGLGPASRVVAMDPLTGRTVFEGWAEFPGEEHTNAGQAWELTAVGNAALLYDKAAPMIYVDRDLNAWSAARASTMPQSARAEVTDNPRNGVGEGLFTGLPKGTTLGLAIQSQIGYTRMRDAGVKVGGIGITVTAGRDDGDFRSDLTWTADGVNGSARLQHPDGIFTSSTRRGRAVGLGGSPPVGTDVLAVRLIRTTSGGAGTDVPNETYWLWHTDPVVIGQRMNRYGTPLVGNDLVTVEYVRADWVVADVIARYLPQVGAELAVIEPPGGGDGSAAWLIDQFAFDSPVRAGEIFEALDVFEPDMVYEMLETVEGRGVRFNYRSWLIPDTFGDRHRYELSMSTHQIELPGADSDLCDRIAVGWLDPRGRERVTTVTLPVAALVAAGRSPHDAERIDLGEGIGSASNATRAGQRALAALNAATSAGTALVTGVIYDRLRQRVVAPHEIEAGYLVLIREKGTTVRLTDVEYDDDNHAAVLTLNKPARTQDQVLARIATRARVSRRS